MGAGHKEGRKERLERLQRAGCLCLGNEDSLEQGTAQTRSGLGKGSLGHAIHLEDSRARGNHRQPRQPEQLSTYPRVGLVLLEHPDLPAPSR